MNQMEFIHNFSVKTTEKFNDDLFVRSDDKIIDALENIILSCERDGFVKIKVLRFTIIDDYEEIREKLKQYEAYLLSKSSSKTKGLHDNKYEYIDLKSSDVKLLIVTYYIETKGESDIFDVLIAIPRVINKFYFRLNGVLYNALYQIVDASTYNTTNKNKHCITLKTVFHPIRIYRNIERVKTYDGQELMCCTYHNSAFKKSIPVMSYIFAKMGLYNGLNFIGIHGGIFNLITDPTKADNVNNYIIKISKKCDLFLVVPKMMYDKNNIVQHIVHTFVISCKSVTEDEIQNIYTTQFWMETLGSLFSNASTDPIRKCMNVLNSIEMIYDIETRNELHLPDEYKVDVYHILRWMIQEYNNLRIKDNLNILTKKIRCGEYIAALYAAKLSTSIYRITDNAKDIDLAKIRKLIITNPMFLVTEMCKNQLVNPLGMVTDMDSLLSSKFTYKGEAGIKSISSAYKLLNISNMGILDPDASPPSDPGSSGSIAPLIKLYDNNYFSEFEEPLTWEKEYAELYNNYKATLGIKELYDMDSKLLHDKEIDTELKRNYIAEVNAARALLKSTPIAEEVEEGIPLEGSGKIIYG